jgi:hypothetical protein
MGNSRCAVMTAGSVISDGSQLVPEKADCTNFKHMYGLAVFVGYSGFVNKILIVPVAGGVVNARKLFRPKTFFLHTICTYLHISTGSKFIASMMHLLELK